MLAGIVWGLASRKVQEKSRISQPALLNLRTIQLSISLGLQGRRLASSQTHSVRGAPLTSFLFAYRNSTNIFNYFLFTPGIFISLSSFSIQSASPFALIYFRLQILAFPFLKVIKSHYRSFCPWKNFLLSLLPAEV